MKWDIETPIPTEKIVSNIKTILKLESKISAIKSCLDCEMSAHNGKTNTPSASIDLALKAIQEKQEKPIQKLEENIDFLQKELTAKNELIKTIMDTQKDLVNTFFNNQEKKPLLKTLNTVAVNKMNKMNNYHHKVNKVSKHTFAPAIIDINIIEINIILRLPGQINYDFQIKITKKVINHNCNIKHTRNKRTNIEEISIKM